MWQPGKAVVELAAGACRHEPLVTDASEPRFPREAGLSGAVGRDALLNIAGLGSACPGFIKTRYSASAVSTTTAQTTERDPQVAVAVGQRLSSGAV